MSRVLRLAGAQMGANQKADSREAILARMVALLEQAAAAHALMESSTHVGKIMLEI